MNSKKEFYRYQPDPTVKLFVNSLIQTLHPTERSFMYKKFPIVTFIQRNAKPSNLILLEKRLRSYQSDLKGILKNLDKSEKELILGKNLRS